MVRKGVPQKTHKPLLIEKSSSNRIWFILHALVWEAFGDDIVLLITLGIPNLTYVLVSWNVQDWEIKCRTTSEYGTHISAPAYLVWYDFYASTVRQKCGQKCGKLLLNGLNIIEAWALESETALIRNGVISVVKPGNKHQLSQAVWTKNKLIFSHLLFCSKMPG